MSLNDLYQEVILDHNRRPRNFGPLAGATSDARGHNPLCGDKVTVSVIVAGDRIEAVHFEGSGCAISKASASLMTEAVKGHTVVEAESLFKQFQAVITSPMDQDIDPEPLGKLAVLVGVREFPVRIKCASLAWHTLHAALVKSPAPATTE